ncbi:zinc-binding dehydrogenase [Streptosporangium subroseum]|uniref:zinc-binding dehydrogenase n=1 Tax=Streptosporangium subroseum TaxID=106412 RepID=UPI00308C5582|nr:zinc-binding dehydrogenase [Streptosporangium subroseum]
MVQAIGVTQPGGPDTLGEFDLAAEPIGPGQVRIRVSSATVNPTDAMLRVTVRGYQGDGTDRVRVAPIFARDYAEAAAELDRLAELAGEGLLTIRVAGELPASRAADAHRSLERHGVRGRFVLRFG